MWQPDPRWEPLRRGSGPSTAGVWRAEADRGDWVVKRLVRPDEADLELADPASDAYWGREAHVARSGLVVDSPGLRSPEPGAVDEDDEGVTLWFRHVEPVPVAALDLAGSLGRFAALEVRDHAWLASRVLRTRLGRAEARGGWPWLASLGRLPGRVWAERRRLLDDVEELPRVAAHGDPVPDNLLAPAGDGGRSVIAADWGLLGRAAPGADLGYLWLSVGGDLTGLAEPYAAALGSDLHAVLLGARTAATLTVLTRAEWALARALGAAPEDPALRADRAETAVRHPSVATALRAVRRVSPQAERLLGSG